MASTKRDLFRKRRMRTRNKLRAVDSGRARLSVHRSSKNISVQLIDDAEGRTLAQANSREADVSGDSPVAKGEAVGQLLAERAKAAGVETAVFDRGGYRYHGRVRAVAEGARKGGLTL